MNLTIGMQVLGEKTILDICLKVMKFDEFTQDNDSYGEHDFGIIQHEEHKIFWKIDYYDLKLQFHYPDKYDPVVTTRMLTVMLAEDY